MKSLYDSHNLAVIAPREGKKQLSSANVELAYRSLSKSFSPELLEQIIQDLINPTFLKLPGVHIRQNEVLSAIDGVKNNLGGVLNSAKEFVMTRFQKKGGKFYNKKTRNSRNFRKTRNSRNFRKTRNFGKTKNYRNFRKTMKNKNNFVGGGPWNVSQSLWNGFKAVFSAKEIVAQITKTSNEGIEILKVAALDTNTIIKGLAETTATSVVSTQYEVSETLQKTRKLLDVLCNILDKKTSDETLLIKLLRKDIIVDFLYSIYMLFKIKPTLNIKLC
jgi:hypothetical protein